MARRPAPIPIDSLLARVGMPVRDPLALRWKELLGPGAASVRIQSLQDGVLTVGPVDSVWKGALERRSAELVGSLARLGVRSLVVTALEPRGQE